jgi:predicted metal-dependent hydrolase
MSNIDNTVESVTDTPVEGQVDANAEIGEALEAEPREYFAWDEYADKPVKLTVDGEEIEVPLSEALSGYQRQADYTRKTQELAEQRRQVQFAAALQEALQNDPASTVELLSQHYGVNQQPTSEEEEFLDPVEKQYRQLESRIQAFEQEKAMRELENQIESLSRRYGELFDANEVVAKALATGSTNLEATYKQIAFDRLFEQSKPKGETKVKPTEEKIVEAKREAAVVSKGASAKSADVSSKPIRSVRDAFESAKRQLEG